MRAAAGPGPWAHRLTGGLGASLHRLGVPALDEPAPHGLSWLRLASASPTARATRKRHRRWPWVTLAVIIVVLVLAWLALGAVDDDGRMLSNTFAGIAPSSVPSFVLAQALGGMMAILIIVVLYPRLSPQQAGDILVPHADRIDQELLEVQAP